PVLPDRLIVFRRNDPAGPAHIGGAQQDRKIEKRLLEVEADGATVDDLDPLGLLVKHFARRAVIMLVAPFDIFGRDRHPVVELDVRPQPEGSALSVLGKLKALGERRVVVTNFAEVFDQRVMQCHQEIVPARRAVVLLRVKPARGDVGMPSQYHLALGNDCRSCAGATYKRCRESRRRQRCCPQHGAPCQRRLLHCFLPTNGYGWGIASLAPCTPAAWRPRPSCIRPRAGTGAWPARRTCWDFGVTLRAGL